MQKIQMSPVRNNRLLKEQILLLKPISADELNQIFIFHKPGLIRGVTTGYVSSFCESMPKHEGASLSDYFKRQGLDKRFPVTDMLCFGRLDKDTSGLLVIAKRNHYPKFTDQLLLNPVFKPSGSRVTKVYRAWVKGLADPAKLCDLKSVIISGKNDVPVEVRAERMVVLKTEVPHQRNSATWIEIEIDEGKHHQVKKMFYALGHPVRAGGLHRTCLGSLSLAETDEWAAPEMPVGSVRGLFPREKIWLVALYNEWLVSERIRLKMDGMIEL